MNLYELNKITNKIILGDSLEKLKKIPDKSVDLIFSDPPYFMQTTGVLKRFEGTDFKGVNDEWDKFASYKDYDWFSKKWLKECKRILKDNGSIWVIGTFHNIYRLGYILQDLEFWILNDVIWAKSNPTPNFKGTKFVNSQENLIWAVKSKNSKYTFNYKTMKYLNDGKQMGSIWKIPIVNGKERLKDENGKKLHNTQKPERLLEKIILATTKRGDVVLDPFFGTGTTGAMAKKLNRNFIGIEKNEFYIDIANERIKSIVTIDDDLTNNVFDLKIKYPNIQNLINDNKLTTQTLYNKNGDEVTLSSNGKVIYQDTYYSIHKATKLFENGKYLNGWKYWYIKDSEGNKILIDEIRKSY